MTNRPTTISRAKKLQVAARDMTAERTSAQGGGILMGVDEIVERHLGVSGIGTRSPRYKNLSACRALSGKLPAGFRAVLFVEDILAQIERNWRASGVVRNPSAENWRFKKQLRVDPDSKGLEKTLEKAIAREGGEAWVNQVPTAASVVKGKSDQLRNLDLVFRVSSDCFEFIELKYGHPPKHGSNTPLYAAIEILVYGMLYIFSRLNLQRAERLDSPLFSAKVVHLRVLAPTGYYHGYEFAWLEAALTAGIRSVIKKRGLPMMMDFKFTAFPDDFHWPCSDEVLLAALAKRGPVIWAA